MRDMNFHVNKWKLGNINENGDSNDNTISNLNMYLKTPD